MGFLGHLCASVAAAAVPVCAVSARRGRAAILAPEISGCAHFGPKLALWDPGLPGLALWAPLSPLLQPVHQAHRAARAPIARNNFLRDSADSASYVTFTTFLLAIWP